MVKVDDCERMNLKIGISLAYKINRNGISQNGKIFLICASEYFWHSFIYNPADE